MKELINFYIKPNLQSHVDNLEKLFRKSILLYFLSVLSYSIASFITIDKTSGFTLPNTNILTTYFIKTIGLLLKQPIQILFSTFGCYLILNIVYREKITITGLYKQLFVAFSLVIISFFVDTINVLLSHYFNFHLMNLLKYSVNDLLTKVYDCSQSITSFLSRINLLLLFSLMYAFYLIKNTYKLDRQKLVIIIPASILLVQLLFSSIPLLIQIIFSLIST